MSRSLTSLVVIGLIGLLQVAAIMTIGQGFKLFDSNNASSQVMEEEVDFDEAMTEERVSLVVSSGSHRCEVEQRPPAPVHLEREGRPPPA